MSKAKLRSWKKMKKAFLAAALLCAGATTALAQNYSIHVEWGYVPPDEPLVTGFCLYQEGVRTFCLDSSNNPDPANATALDTAVNLTTTITTFTLTATFNDGTESPHSAPFAFSHVLDETKPTPTLYKVTSVASSPMQALPYLSSLESDRQLVTGFGLRRALNGIYGLGPLKKAVPVRSGLPTNEQLVAQSGANLPRAVVN